MTLTYLIEDDIEISRVVVRTLGQHGIEVATFRRLADFRMAIARQLPDLCLIDLALPDGDGLEMIRHGVIPAHIPRIVVSARGHLTDRVVGLELGADDYIVKPFEPRELAARVRAVLRRTRPAEQTAAARTLTFGDWTADLDACTLVHVDGEAQELSAAEASLLQALSSAPGRILTRAQLLEATTGRSDEPFDRSMDARISRLRKKLRDDPNAPQIIRTVYGAGYVFVPVSAGAPRAR